MAGALESGPTTAGDALAAWLDHLRHERRASPRTLEAYADCAGRYLGFLASHRGGPLSLQDLAGVSAAEVRAYLAFRRQGPKPLSPRSIAQALSAIRGLHRYLDRRHGAANPALALVRGPRVKPSAPRPVSEDQARGLICEAEGDPDREPWEAARDAALLTLLYGCGLRISEALSLTRADAPLGPSLRVLGKGSKTRISPVLPAPSRWVAKEWRRAWGVALSGRPSRPRSDCISAWACRGLNGPPRLARNRASSGSSVKGRTAT